VTRPGAVAPAATDSPAEAAEAFQNPAILNPMTATASPTVASETNPAMSTATNSLLPLPDSAAVTVTGSFEASLTESVAIAGNITDLLENFENFESGILPSTSPTNTTTTTAAIPVQEGGNDRTAATAMENVAATAMENTATTAMENMVAVNRLQNLLHDYQVGTGAAATVPVQ
jgi:hypothetical protein